MAKLELTVKQVIDLVKQLPTEDKSAVLQALKQDKETNTEDKASRQEQKLRAYSAARGVDWDRLSEDDREVLAKSFQHKDR
ncbi:MAG TPA: hypothetical protein DCE56_36400 [Cyanobacteria bacterium UBA8553]|nr:hypothetical protein [Cyanobacteria bacterium UBA8553]HAJ64448.1 hypothetical protein [Cyanobacteria bacterium UBA8543]